MDVESETYEVYALRSLKDGKRYIGITVNSDSRLASHNWGRTRSTKARRPFVLVHVEIAKNRLEARNREKYLKSAAGRRFLDDLEANGLK